VAIIVTGHEMEKLIDKGVHRTDEQVAKAASEALLEENLSDKDVAMSFNTTAGNTGLKNGSFTLFQEKLGKDFFLLACCNHKSSGPNVKLFTLFKSIGLIQEMNAYNYSILVSDNILFYVELGLEFQVHSIMTKSG